MVDKIWVLKGGYNAWKEAGYPLEPGTPQEVLMIVPGYGDSYMMISPGGNVNVGNR
jgi:hypothetical protein